jgi:ribosomal protein S27E
VDEILAFHLAIKIRYGLSDEAFYAILEGENASMVQKTVHKALPVRKWQVSKQLQGFIPFHFKFVTYCPKCENIIETSDEPLKEVDCDGCGYDLKDTLAEGGAYFIVFPIRKQIEAYCSRPKFQTLVRKFRTVKYGKVNGYLHANTIESGHFNLTIATDGATLSKWSQTTLFPIVLFFNNIPISYQVVFPIICALYCGPSNLSPPRHVFFKFLVDELRDLEVNPIEWKYDTGVPVTSLTYVTICCSDGPEKAKLMNHRAHGGYYSCPYCKYKGVIVKRDATSLFPAKSGRKKDVARKKTDNNQNQENEGNAQKGNKGYVKYPKLNHKAPLCDWRNAQERVEIGEKIVRKAEETGEIAKVGVEGVLGLGVLNGFSKFNETGSHAAGILHVICEGLLKDIMNLVISDIGNSYSLRKKGGTWDNVERLQSSRTKVSEANYNCKSPRQYGSWRAYDFYQLLMHDVALLFSDEQIITDEEFQKMMFLLSESVYLLSYGRMDANVRRQAREKVEQFSEAFLKCLGPEWCTYKFHIFQHMPDLCDRHGPAFLWDDFNLERINYLAKETVTASRSQMEQAGKHFLLKHHSDVLQDPSHYQESVKEQLKRNGFHQEVFFMYDDFNTETTHEPLDGAIYDLVEKEMQSKHLVEVGETVRLTRVTRMIRKNVVVLTSKHFKHKGTVRDFYVLIDEKDFGQIGEILYAEDTATYFLVLEKFAKYDALYSKGNRVLHPFNQFPYRRTGETKVIEMTDELFIQKAQISCLVLAEGTIVNLFSPRPNEFFRF